MSYQKAITANSYKNNGGTVVFGGNADTTNGPITNVPANSLIMSNKAIGQAIGSQVVASTTIGVQKALSSGALATMTKGEYVMKWLGTTLAGVSTNVLNSPANYNLANLRSIHYNENIRTRRVVTAGWNYVTGQPLTTPTLANDSFGQDDAARPSRSVPGEFVIKKSNNPEVSMVDYPAKTD